MTKSMDIFGPIYMKLYADYLEELITVSEDPEEVSDDLVDSDSTEFSDTQINGDRSFEYLD